MQIRDIAWASLKRRKARFAFVLAALAIGVGTIVALVALTRAMQAEVSDELDRFGANIIVTPKSRALDLGYGGLAVGGVTVDAEELRMADIPAIRTIPNKRNISAVAPKLVGTLDVEGQRMVLIGADLREERRVKSWWKVDGRFAASPAEAMLGAEAAQMLHKRVGDVVIIAERRLTVAGLIAATGSLDDRAVFVDLALAQDVLGRPGEVSLIEVSALCRGCPIEDIVQQIGTVLPHARVAPIRQAVAARERAMLQFTRFGYAVSVVVLLVGIMVVMSTMMSSVTERTAEIGILRAVGFRQSQVARMLLVETIAISAAGGLAGWILGTVAARFAGPAMAQLANPVAPPWTLATPAVLLAVLVGTIGGIYPALRAARMDPARALRYL
jgi:putative ABC transport system permease protein